MTPAGIEPSTFRFVAQHLNHCATAYLGVPTLFQDSLLDKGIVLLTFTHNKQTNKQTTYLL